MVIGNLVDKKIFVYKCGYCGHILEKLLKLEEGKIKKGAVIKCDKCYNFLKTNSYIKSRNPKLF